MGAKEIADMLLLNGTLQELYLGDNDISDATPIAKALKMNKGILMLNLEDNSLNNLSAFEFANAIKVNISLGYLSKYLIRFMEEQNRRRWSSSFE